MSSHRALRPVGRLLIALFLLATPFLATSALAEYEAGSNGGGGGSAFHASCTPKALTGLYAFVGSALDRVDLICGTLHKNGTVTEVVPTGAYFGGGGGHLQGQYCPENALVTGMKVWIDHNQQVNSFILRCTYMTSGIQTWTTMQAGGERIDDPHKILCKKNEIGIGIYGRSGNLVDKLGLLCADNPMKVAAAEAPAAPPPPCPEGQMRLKGICQVPPLLPGTSTGTGGGFIQMFPQGGGTSPTAGGETGAAPAVLSCQGGGGMRMTNSTQAGVAIAFSPAAQPANVAPPGPGECAWPDRSFGANEAHQFALDPSTPNAQLLFDAMRGGTFQVTASPNGTFIMVSAINNVQVMDSTPLSPGPVNADNGDDAGDDEAPQTPADMGDTPMQQGGGACGNGNATATVAINQPGLDKLNVRSGPGGDVLGTVAEGDTVSVVGPCGSTHGAAGFAKQTNKPVGGSNGWCQISAPVHGCVSAQFLEFGGGGDAGTNLPNGAAGFAKSKSKQPTLASPSASFAGRWNADADDVAYTLSLRQNGSSVSGRFDGNDGSTGSLSGKMQGNALRFSWKQTDGTRGTGEFVLSDDGQSFEGSYQLSDNTGEGSWNGTRQ